MVIESLSPPRRTVHLDDILRQVSSYHEGSDLDVIMRAYVFTAKVHRGQSRRSGEPYLSHPLEVAKILADLRMDPDTVAAGFLHDTVEDTYATLSEIREAFDDKMAELVDGVTKIGRIELISSQEKQAENYRKMILAMAKDIRVIIIKLADRLHNMKTLDSLPPRKQRLVARETLDIYAPIANRLGIGWLKAELEDLAFRYINPASYREIKERLATGVEERRAYIQEVSDEVMRRLDEAKIPARVEGRLKHIHSIYNKMRNQNISFTDVHDLVALRIITDSVRNCYAILGIIHSTWTPVPGRFKDYIALPKANMYQSIHTTVMGPRGHRVEFQLRTEEMHLTAEEGIAAHWKYKEGGKDDEADARFSWLRRLLEWQHDLKDPREFLDTVRVDLYPEDVYVFTPKGEVKSFPRGATPVDFAYYIHTEVGNHCVGAKVNGRIVPLKYELKNGDVVEIITSPNRTPGRDWLNFVKTSRARTKIRAWIRAAQRERSVALGREILEKELVRYGADPADVLKGQRLEELARSLNYQEGRDLLAAIGFGKVSAVQLVHKLLPREVVEAHLRRHESRLRRIVERVARKTREGGVRVDGHHDMLIRFAKCCNPVPGERIVGFITRGRGVTVHAADCPNMRDLDYEEDRRVEVSWVYDQECRHRVMVALDTVDEPGVLAGVSSAIASLNANIASIHAATTDDKRAHIDLCIEIRDLQHLQQILKAIQQVRGVSRAFRVKDPSAAGRGQAG